MDSFIFSERDYTTNTFLLQIASGVPFTDSITGSFLCVRCSWLPMEIEYYFDITYCGLNLYKSLRDLSVCIRLHGVITSLYKMALGNFMSELVDNFSTGRAGGVLDA
ncbi:hypothetical protein ACJX0J_017000, partial [Zea mays]